LYQRDRAAVAFVSLEPGSLQQMARNHALHHLQRRSPAVKMRTRCTAMPYHGGCSFPALQTMPRA
jgi:hypothetical protein